MGVYALWEISRRNYDSPRGAKPLKCYHNSWGIFLAACTCPYINEFITRGNRKINADRDADGLFSTAPPLTGSDSALSRSLPTMYEIGKPWDKRWQTAHLNHLVSNLHQQRPVQEPRRHFYTCTKFYEHNRPCYERDRPCCKHRAPVTSLWRMATPSNACAVPFILWLPE